LFCLSHITINVIFSDVCGQIDLKFGGDLHVDLLFQFLLLFFSVPPLTPPSPPFPPPFSPSPQNLNFFVINGVIITLEKTSCHVNGQGGGRGGKGYMEENGEGGGRGGGGRGESGG
jgi:uncharacterized membrane protein YgcG